uniref:Uncharacterized protein n=1 Tax=Schistosoma japonicum TaxID=6182 RepID=C1LFJ4_SCHJA|nr:hypothetical protein [Schistosoma japonicum]
MLFKKFLFLFMSSLVTCWGIDTPEYKSNISAYPDLPEKLNILLDEEKKGLYDALIQKSYGDLENAFLKTCEATKSFWGALEKFYDQVNTTEHTNEAHANLKKKYPKSCESNILFGKAIEKYFEQLNTTEHTNEEKFYDQVNTTEHTNEEKFYDQVNTTEHTNEEKFYDQVNTTEHTNEEKFCDQVNTTEHTNEAHGDLPETFWESLVDGMLFLEFLEKLELHLQESFEDYLEQWNTLKEVELMAIEAYKKYKNTEDDIQNFEEYKNVSQKLFHEIGYLVDLEGEFLYRTVQYEKGLSKEKRRETDLDYYKRVADYYSEILLV